MAYDINNNITLGSYVFVLNPGSYNVKYEQMITLTRSINGTLQGTAIDDGTGNAVTKRIFSLGGVCDPSDMIEDIEAEMTKYSSLTFISPDDITYTVRIQPGSFEKDINESMPWIPAYKFVLIEV